MMRWMNQADIVLKNTKSEDLHFYFFTETDLLGICACYNLRLNEPWESTVEYGSREGFVDEIEDMLAINHYEVAQDRYDRIVKRGDEWRVLSEIETLQMQKRRLSDNTSLTRS